MASMAHRFIRLVPAWLMLSGLAAGCSMRAPTYTGGQSTQMPGTDAVVRALTRSQSSLGAQELRQLGTAFTDVAAFDKDKDGRLNNQELLQAIDLAAFDNETLTEFYAAGPDANRTLPASARPRADRNSDGRLTPAEWLFDARDSLVRRMNSGVYDDGLVATLNVMWKRPDLPALYERLAPLAFSLADVAPKDDKVTKEEVTGVGGDGKLFEAAAHGTQRPAELAVFSAILHDSRSNVLRMVGTAVKNLDRDRDLSLRRTEIDAGKTNEDYGPVLSVLVIEKETLTRFELERLILRSFAQPVVPKSLVKWSWTLGAGPKSPNVGFREAPLSLRR